MGANQPDACRQWQQDLAPLARNLCAEAEVDTSQLVYLPVQAAFEACRHGMQWVSSSAACAHLLYEGVLTLVVGAGDGLKALRRLLELPVCELRAVLARLQRHVPPALQLLPHLLFLRLHGHVPCNKPTISVSRIFLVNAHRHARQGKALACMAVGGEVDGEGGDLHLCDAEAARSCVGNLVPLQLDGFVQDQAQVICRADIPMSW